MKNRDRDIIVAAVQDARHVLGAYIEPGPRDPAAAMNEMLRILDDENLVAALDRIDRRNSFRLVR